MKEISRSAQLSLNINVCKVHLAINAKKIKMVSNLGPLRETTATKTASAPFGLQSTLTIF
jgi:hypothetical protein